LCQLCNSSVFFLGIVGDCLIVGRSCPICDPRFLTFFSSSGAACSFLFGKPGFSLFLRWGAFCLSLDSPSRCSPAPCSRPYFYAVRVSSSSLKRVDHTPSCYWAEAPPCSNLAFPVEETGVQPVGRFGETCSFMRGVDRHRNFFFLFSFTPLSTSSGGQRSSFTFHLILISIFFPASVGSSHQAFFQREACPAFLRVRVLGGVGRLFHGADPLSLMSAYWPGGSFPLFSASSSNFLDQRWGPPF